MLAALRHFFHGVFGTDDFDLAVFGIFFNGHDFGGFGCGDRFGWQFVLVGFGQAEKRRKFLRFKRHGFG